MPHPAFALADDLSGALEVAGEYHLLGWRSALPVGDAAAPACCPWPIDLAVVSTETRLARGLRARSVLREALDRLPGGGRAVAYKKIDSTLRGPVGEELAELLAGTPGRSALVSPANPLAGRTVLGGVLHVDGVPVARTDFASDPAWPITDSRVGALLEAAGVPWGTVELSTVRAGDEALVARLAERIDAGCRAVVADACSEADLATLARSVAASGGGMVPVGSGGLARALAALGAPVGASGPRPAVSGSRGGARLVVCGSAHRASREQVEMLGAREGVPIVEMFPPSVAASERAGRLARCRREAGEWLCRRGAAALVAGRGAWRVVGELGSEAVGEWLEALLRGLSADVAIGAVLAAGGETARRACAALGSQWLGLVARLEPGLSASVDAPGGRLWLTKPGGFGQCDTMCRAWRWLDRAVRPGAGDEGL